jgi:hypothetical protein
LDPEWNIRFVVFEPGTVKTAYSTGNMERTSRHEAYRRSEGRELPMEKLGLRRREMEEKVGARSEDIARVMVETVIDRESKWGGRSMLRLPVGADAWAMERKDIEELEVNLEYWREVSESTSSGDAKGVLRSVGLMRNRVAYSGYIKNTAQRVTRTAEFSTLCINAASHSQNITSSYLLKATLFYSPLLLVYPS